MSAPERCRYASPCPCGCGWAMCGIYGGWVERPDCEECGDFDPGSMNEEETDHEEDQVPVSEGD